MEKIVNLENIKEVTIITCVNCENIIDTKEAYNKDEIKIMLENNICYKCFNDQYIECEECGEIFTSDNIKYIPNTDMHVCSSCLESNYTKCDDCGEYFYNDDLISVDNLEVCEQCLDYGLGDIYFQCSICDEYHHTADYTENIVYDNYNGYEVSICDCCFENDTNIIYCDWHERYEIEEYGGISDGTITICQDAYENYYNRCEDCETLIHIDYCYYNEDSGCVYCEECYEINNSNLIKSYHKNKNTHKDNMKIKSNNSNVLTYGFELEIEKSNSSTNKSDMADMIEEVSSGLYVYENDGSLHDGFEVISRPYDIEYYNQDGQEIINNTLDIIQKEGYRSHAPGTCGLHVHVGNNGLGNSFGEINHNIFKIAYIVELFKNELTIISRRKSSQLSRWAKFLTSNNKEDITLGNIIKLYSENYSRYTALNLANSATIEFRLFRGTLKKESFHAVLECVHNICKYAIDHDFTELKENDYKKIFTYDIDNYISNYMISKNLL